MRPIKFRAWDEANKRMFPVREINFHEDGNHSITEWRDGGHERWTSPLNGNSEYEKWIHLMQFTGLKDKNGKEIYEGDIFKESEGQIWRVVFESGMFVGRELEESGDFDNGPICADYVEVIGNIYEHPELVK